MIYQGCIEILKSNSYGGDFLLPHCRDSDYNSPHFQNGNFVFRAVSGFRTPPCVGDSFFPLFRQKIASFQLKQIVWLWQKSWTPVDLRAEHLKLFLLNACVTHVIQEPTKNQLTVYSPCFFPYHFIHFLNSLSMVWRKEHDTKNKLSKSQNNATQEMCIAEMFPERNFKNSPLYLTHG